MKRILIALLALLSISPSLSAQTKKKTVVKKKSTAAKVEEVADNKEIHWITSIDELQEKMKAQPKKVIIDMYTGWCGWCKKMDAATYTNPALIKYVNNNYYAVRFDAERHDTIHFQGKDFYFAPQYRANGFALELLKGQMSYPTTVFMLENFQNPIPYPGYMTVPQMETILTFYGDNVYRHQNGQEYQKNYHPMWEQGQPDMSPPAGHQPNMSPTGH